MQYNARLMKRFKNNTAKKSGGAHNFFKSRKEERAEERARFEYSLRRLEEKEAKQRLAEQEENER